MTPEQQFLQAILTAPDDDAPRLLFADWLEEREDPRGEFIRVQCELAKVVSANDLDAEDSLLCGHGDENGDGKCDLCDRYDALRGREWGLLSAEQDRFCELFRVGDDDVWWTAWEFRRGFVEVLECRFADWLIHCDRILTLTPLREVQLADEPRLFSYEQGDGRVYGLRGVGKAEFWHDKAYVLRREDIARRLLALEWPKVRFTWPGSEGGER